VGPGGTVRAHAPLFFSRSVCASACHPSFLPSNSAGPDGLPPHRRQCSRCAWQRGKVRRGIAPGQRGEWVDRYSCAAPPPMLHATPHADRTARGPVHASGLFHFSGKGAAHRPNSFRLKGLVCDGSENSARLGLFDGRCGVCTALVGLVEGLDCALIRRLRHAHECLERFPRDPVETRDASVPHTENVPRPRVFRVDGQRSFRRLLDFLDECHLFVDSDQMCQLPFGYGHRFVLPTRL
jgi:hypothetical protein